MQRRFEWKNLINLFRITYLEKENIPISDTWKELTMQRIRSLSWENGRLNFSVMFEQFVWRLAPVTFVMILAISIWLSSYEIISDAEIFRLFSFELEASYAFLLLD
jgi:hypothetical protein